jgi:hypothetical protein
VPLVLIPFGVLAAGLFLLAYTHTASAHQGAATTPKRSGGILGALTLVLPVLAPLERGVKRAVDWAINSVRGWVSHWALAHVKAVARWFVGLNLLAQRVAREQSGLANDTADALQKMRHHVIPHAVQVGVAPVRAEARTADRHASTALTRERALRSTVTTEHRAQVKLNVHYSHAIDSSLPWALPRTRTRVGTLEREYDGLKQRTKALEDGAIDTFKWLSAHRTTAAMGVFTGAVAWALSRLGYGFLRCRSWQNFGRSLRCSDANILAELLAGATAVALGVGLVELAKAEQEVVGDLATVVRDFWQA